MNTQIYQHSNASFFEIIQFALGNRSQLSHSLSVDEWNSVYEMSLKQSVAGICFTSIQKLPLEQRPPEILFWDWFGFMIQIQQQNDLMNERSAEVWEMVIGKGLDAAVLKGQGIAQEYGKLASFRQSGDIDIWVKGGYKKVCDYVQKIAPTDEVAYHRFHFNVYRDTDVELHHRPIFMKNLIHNKKTSRWYESFGPDSFVFLEDKGFAVPSAKFNRIFILLHIYKHFLSKGIGLRQVMDYYFVLKSDVRWDKDDVVKTFSKLKLMKFAEAMMWILHTKFGLDKQYLLCEMNEKEGLFVLNEIMLAGNFGCGDSRYRYQHFSKLRWHIAHGVHLIAHYPSEVIWTPVWLIYHKIWKWNKKKQIRDKFFS